jgi:hypothetical protein
METVGPKARARGRGPRYDVTNFPCTFCGGGRAVGGDASSAGHGQEAGNCESMPWPQSGRIQYDEIKLDLSQSEIANGQVRIN